MGRAEGAASGPGDPASAATAGAALPPGREGAVRVATALLPIVLALAAGALLLLLLGADPGAFYYDILRRGLFSWIGLQDTITRCAPLLLLGASLIVAFRAGLWNLGVDGQFLLAAVISAALAPVLVPLLPVWVVLPLVMLVAMAVGALWSLLPAVLKAWHGVNEIVTTLMMSFLGISAANVLIKLPFDDPGTTVPQTMTLATDDRLPRLFGSTINLGTIVGLAVILFVHWLMTRTAFGLRLRLVGANPRAAIHAGLPLGALTIAVFALSAGLAVLAGSVEILGVWGNVRADWNPAYGLMIIPLVFLARFNGIAVIGLTFFFAVLSIGGETASRKANLPNYFILVLVALMLIFLALTEWLDHRRRMARGK